MAVVLMLLLGFLIARTARADRPSPHGDRPLYPRAYGILTSDRLMFPVDMSDWPLKISSARQLFVDDYLLAAYTGLDRRWFQPAKHPQNPVMSPRLPWEDQAVIPLEIRRDPETSLFRMWYTSRLRYREPGGMSVRLPTLYAESPDGLEWVRPELGLLDHAGSRANNFVIHAGRIEGLFYEPDDPCPARRFKALVLHEPDYVDREGYYFYTSPDGLRWTRHLPEMAIPALGSFTMPQNGLGDTTIFRFDPLLGRYVCDAKFVLPGELRCRGQCESDDLIHWSRPRFTVYPDDRDEPDAQIYANLSFPYESMWLGLCRIMHTQRTGWKQTEVELSMSRDGYHWTRPDDRQPFLPLGDPDGWEPDYTDPARNGPLLVGDELWFFYRGSRHAARDSEPCEYLYSSMEVGLATLRRDGFAALHAGDASGTLTTRPISFSGGRLHINARTSPDGYIRTAVLDRSGLPLPGYELERAIPFTGDSTRAPLAWEQNDALHPIPNHHIRLLFQLCDADLFSFWIEPRPEE